MNQMRLSWIWEWVGYEPEAPLRETIPFQQTKVYFHFSFLGFD